MKNKYASKKGACLILPSFHVYSLKVVLSISVDSFNRSTKLYISKLERTVRSR